MSVLETPQRIEPTLLDSVPSTISDAIAELASKAALLGQSLHPRTAANLADLVRLMNTYYSNLIEGHNTRPRDIERALIGEFEAEGPRRSLQIEAAAHIRVQRDVDRMALDKTLPEPASSDFLRYLHHEFYKDASPDMLRIEGSGRTFEMAPGEWRSRPEHDNVVGRHIPPSSGRIHDFMQHFAWRYRLAPLGTSQRIMAVAAAHHRMNFIHPFPDGNGRVSRLMSHAMAHTAGIGAHGLWSISRGLARGLESRTEYRRMMDQADSPRQGDLDGRGNLSEAALKDFILWFLRVCIDQVMFMSSLFELKMLSRRLSQFVERSVDVRPEAAWLLDEAMMRGQIERGDVARITRLPERSARRVLEDLTRKGLLASETPKGPVSLRFPVDTLEVLFPRLFPET
jgi:Fic family protein